MNFVNDNDANISLWLLKFIFIFCFNPNILSSCNNLDAYHFLLKMVFWENVHMLYLLLQYLHLCCCC